MLETQRNEKLQAALFEMDRVVFKGYLENICEYSVIPVETELEEAIQKIRIRKVSKIIYDRNEDNLGKFNSVFSSMHSCNSAVVLLIKGSKTHTDIYVCSNKSTSDAGFSGTEAMQTLESAVKGNFPGIDISQNLVAKDIASLLKPIQGSDFSAISSVAGVPSLKSDDVDSFSQGLEKIIDGMRGREYVALIQATPVSRRELEHVEGAFQDIYTALSIFEQKQVTLSENESRAAGIAVTDGITKTLSESVGDTQTRTDGTSSSKSISNSKTQSDFDLKKSIAGAVSGAAAGAGTAAVSTAGVGIVPGALVGGLIGLSSNLFGGSKTVSDSVSDSSNSSNASSKSITKSSSQSSSNSRTDTDTFTSGTGKTLQITEKNRRISALLASIDSQLSRIDECKNYGMWSWGAYFLGASELDVRLGADLYSGILRGDSTGLERNSIAVWKRSANSMKFIELQKYLAQLIHPIFQTPKNFVTRCVSHASLISTKEMAVAMSFPQKSLPGIPVLECVAFGRSVTQFERDQSKESICIGQISNFGIVDPNYSVDIDLASLTGHTFITGSTGSGKSNAIYTLLETLHTKRNIPFLVIEPAKGEYKEVFGGRKDVHVFGTNAKLTPLLRLNPFSFPKNVHVMEHIDRLIEILNAVWPMYAAMPAILKEAIECTYEKIGWDLINSDCLHSAEIFPDFYDLLDVLPEVINQSDYSQEIKGNYAGALVTRIRSLTNGYFKSIFQKDELDSAQLFDQSCIVDLSRVGSSETKALLMGILFLKLQEYRISNASGSNVKLRHITVLEEAHNLLRKSSNSQSEDSSNVQGKSVEMISNAIAEMRTYGEGFIIADQAPGLLDSSVIRNTNTKIIFRLPDFEDRCLVGKAARLDDNQIGELARINRGCAAVYQNDWLEPVLCKFRPFDPDKMNHFVHTQVSTKLTDNRRQSLTEFVKILVNISFESSGDKVDVDFDGLNLSAPFPSIKEIRLMSKKDLSESVISHINLFKILDRVPKVGNVDVWIKHLNRQMTSIFEPGILTTREELELLKIVLQFLAIETPQNKEVFEISIKKLEVDSGCLL